MKIALLASILPALLLTQVSTPLNLNGQAIYRASCDGGITCTKSGQTLTIIGSGGSAPSGSSDFDGGYNRIQDEGVDLTKRTTVDFTGAGVTCIDTGSKTACDIPGGGSGGASPLSRILGTP